MLRKITIAAILTVLLALTAGCSLFRTIDNSSPEEMRKFQSTKDELWEQTVALEREKAAYQKQLAEQEAQLARANQEREYWKQETAQADQRFAELNKTVDGLNAQLKQQPEAPPPKPAAPVGNQLLIRVLSGNGKLPAAQKLAKRLEAMGYRISGTDLARRWDYKVTTIFYGPGNKKDALTMAKRLGKGVVVKPRTWRSIYNLIVVSGRRT